MTTLRIATWNCFGTPQTPWGMLLKIPPAPERLLAPEVAETLAGFDIVCVQENFVPRTRSALREIAARLGFRVLWRDRPPRPRRFCSGLAVLSRFPAELAALGRFRHAAGYDAWAKKGWVALRVFLPGGRRIHILNTHLQAGAASDGRVARTRRRQIDVLARELTALREAGDVVLCGDLNVVEGSGEYTEHLARPLGPNLADLARGRGLHTCDPETNDLLRAHGARHEPQRLDYIWAAGALRVRQVAMFLHRPLTGLPPRGRLGRPFASDHYGLGAELTLG